MAESEGVVLVINKSEKKSEKEERRVKRRLVVVWGVMGEKCLLWLMVSEECLVLVVSEGCLVVSGVARFARSFSSEGAGLAGKGRI